ncbi:hypothetical protein D6D23_07862 [Aureobasidium pullulans]|uniref:Uncharacterized protein n=1 Tax=Aureobasidium pullulans TaxID=5580 RepID=A0A4S9E2S6_AURPU|nr:hypothetical protein D6D24_06536 [Aureobasidium pullulans]THW18014.1 hypothetical protein D6D23_07862 [Aureobasidium pullulans]THX28142.1 hypothetical protein D6D10_09266 [Aureobasidium pullulans]THY37640.1 hypothetical protein D6C99_09548 [Aureobasidium pullulans]CAD0058539.1 unnamed protein product [Aureobasidium pullulans]
MRPTTYLLALLAAASTTLAAVDISGLPHELQECIEIGGLNTDWKHYGPTYNSENLSIDQVCNLENPHPISGSRDNRLIKGKWATWMDKNCGGHDIGRGAEGKMCKKQP